MAPQDLSSLPAELLLAVTEFLDAETYIRLSQTCSLFRYLLFNSPRRWAFGANPDVLLTHSGLDVTFTQNHGPDASDLLYDSVITVLEERNGTVRYNRVYRGLRCRGDRSVVGGMPLCVLPIGWKQRTNPSMAYYEIKVTSTHDGTWRIGLAREGYSSVHPVGILPYSVGYCSEDGSVALGHRDGERFQFAPPWKSGDIVGCGYLVDQGDTLATVFFTLNGFWVGDAPYVITSTPYDYREIWFPVVTSSVGCQVQINLGQEPFAYKLANSMSGATHLATKRLWPRPRCVDATSATSDLVMAPNPLPHPSDPYISAVLPSPYTLHFPDIGSTTARSCFSTKPIPPQFYYELVVLDPGPNFNSFLSFGLATKPYSSFHHIGWDAHSIGYHTDDGRVYHGAFAKGIKYDTDLELAGVQRGTVLGCGYDAGVGSVYFTRDGRFLGTAGEGIWGELYVAVAAIRAWKVEVNFGKRAFVYHPKEEDVGLGQSFPLVHLQHTPRI
ncbi:uncharacterized protein SPPG_05814 [Spizellomyces punctatus DAOM BR117]|uniref:B30.2/SPRY domain-containing protein n=1 Tax=Spizellomyces punctatus (strain DAOM BR117) TaxID=645134 RepID=A0A0L0HB81_SPIPD|nr:uncharacterized protein SPPG_05814 [Spizellomyces punctatus DAOM BR117]KNC98840.1 hypothetical protein SPPG_05814 [Spizellomyces punctatus DAOM BR117]|eukprot:XP_016606880.1 hypothetical protein SPPG_05814 [Spizellomyces punctatus DAOM BR117]